MKVLIIQLRQLGDVLLSTPLCEVIKKYYPDAEVHFLTSDSASQIISENIFIDKIKLIAKGMLNELKTIIDIRRENYDFIIDVQRTGRSKKIALFSKCKNRIAFKRDIENLYYDHTIAHSDADYTVSDRLHLLEPLGIKYNDIILPKLFYDANTDSEIKSFLNNNNLKIKNYIVAAPTSRKPARSWPPHYFGEVITSIFNATGMKSIITYAPGEEEIAKITYGTASADSVIFPDKSFSIKHFSALINNSAFFIGNDSFSGHVAVSQNVPSFIMTGPNSGWFPKTDNVITFSAGLKCQPCNDSEHCPFFKQTDSFIDCFSKLSPEKVSDTILKWIKK